MPIPVLYSSHSPQWRAHANPIASLTLPHNNFNHPAPFRHIPPCLLDISSWTSHSHFKRRISKTTNCLLSKQGLSSNSPPAANTTVSSSSLWNFLQSTSLLYPLLFFLSNIFWDPFFHPDFHSTTLPCTGLISALVLVPNSPTYAGWVPSLDSGTYPISRQREIKGH